MESSDVQKRFLTDISAIRSEILRMFNNHSYAQILSYYHHNFITWPHAWTPNLNPATLQSVISTMIGLTMSIYFVDGVGRLGTVPVCAWHRQGFKSLSTLCYIPYLIFFLLIKVHRCLTF